MEKHYCSEENVQIIISLLKANGIRKVVASPGATNYSFVGSMQNDPFFEIYSSVDERSAAYIACGLAAESGEPVVLSCTGATASRNYYPGLTEAYYRKLPVLAITSHQGTDRIGQLIFQNVDRRNIANDIALLSVELPVVKDERDRNYVVMEANKAVLELRRNGGGPVHINMITTYSKDFSIKKLPPVRVMRRFHAWDNLPEMPKGSVCVYIGSHRTFTPQQVEALERFCATYDAVAICDHTSGYYGKYRLLPTLTQFQVHSKSPFERFDLMIHIGEVSAATFAGSVPTKNIWRVSEDGELRDPFKKLSTVFQMSEEFFFRHYGRDGEDKHSKIDHYTEVFAKIYERIPELPLSNMWVASQLSSRLPENSLLHLGVSNTRRCWNIFPLPKGVESSCNVGCCGIDGCMSTLVGASLVNTEKLCFIVLGDLTFFYDMNSLGNRHIGNNVRILLINNGIGGEFKLRMHKCYAFGEEANKYMAAGGHYGAKSPYLVKHYAEDLGFEYLSASSKEEFSAVVERFVSPEVHKSMVLEVFTDYVEESNSVEIMRRLLGKGEMAKAKVLKIIESITK